MVRKIFNQSFLWFIALVGASALTFGGQRLSPFTPDPQSVKCCQQVGLVNPSVGLFYLTFAMDGYERKRWQRDLVLALEKRRAKRQARLMIKTASHNSQSLLPLALLKGGAR